MSSHPVSSIQYQFRLSKPQLSLFLSVCRKLFSLRRMRLMANLSFLTASWISFVTISLRLSRVHKKPSVLPSTSKEMILLSGTTMGRLSLGGALARIRFPRSSLLAVRRSRSSMEPPSTENRAWCVRRFVWPTSAGSSITQRPLCGSGLR